VYFGNRFTARTWREPRDGGMVFSERKVDRGFVSRLSYVRVVIIIDNQTSDYAQATLDRLHTRRVNIILINFSNIIKTRKVSYS